MTAPQEPLKLTSEELVAELGANHYSVTVWRGRWSAVPPENSPLAEFEGDTLWEVGSKALGLVVAPRDDAAELRTTVEELLCVAKQHSEQVKGLCDRLLSIISALHLKTIEPALGLANDRGRALAAVVAKVRAALAASEGQP